MQKKWVVKYHDSVIAKTLAESLGIGRGAAAVLAARGIRTPEDAGSFLSPSFAALPDPSLLLGMEQALERLMVARACGERVCIYGDYDVDGITGTALLVSFLRRVGINCTYFIPNRFDDGYGINRDALERIIAMGATLIISVDCGITSVNEAEFCRQQGVDLIIVDHHTPGELIPDACAVINPLRSGCPFPFKSLAGVGVAFNVLIALRGRLRKTDAFVNDGEPDVREWLDLVALGTIADVVPLTGANRVMVQFGLKLLGKSARPGIEALKRVARITDEVSCGQVAFRLAPRLNAAGRMESAVPGVELLLGGDERESEAIASELDAANAERQTIERRMLDEAAAMVDESGRYPACRSIVLASGEWHQGVVGIVASRIVERYHRPAILISIDENGRGRGSGRSIPGFHLLEALTGCSEYLDRFGGHRYAAGIGVRQERLADFAAAFENEALKRLTEPDLVPLLEIDAEVQPSEVGQTMCGEFKRFEPFGAGNPEPVLVMRELRIMEQRVVNGGHLKLRLEAGSKVFDAIAFGQAALNADGRFEAAFYPEMNVWNNRASLQLRIKAIRPME